MKLTLLCLIVLLITILLICDQNGVEAKKKKHGKGGDKYEVKNNYNKDKKDNNRKTEESGKEYNINENKSSKKQENKNKYKNVDGENNNKIKHDKKKEYNDKKNIKTEQKNKGKTKEEIKMEYTNKKTEKYTKKSKENIKLEDEEGLNGRSYDLKQAAKETLVIEEPQIINNNEDDKILKEMHKNEGNVEIIENENREENIIDDKTIESIKVNEKENCNKCNSKKINEEKLLQCNKKTDSVERNTTEICEKYKSEKNTQVFEEKVITDKQEVASNILDTKQPKCEL